MPVSETVILQRATPDTAPILRNLLELYIHDMSAIFQVEPGADGRFGYEPLPLYWSDAESRFAFLITVGGRLAGFALATRGSPASPDPDDLDVAEFFVLRAYRRSGVGRQAAAALWDTLPGRWVVRVSEANAPALPFWRDVIASYTSGAFVEDQQPRASHRVPGLRPGQPSGWRIFRFASSDL